LKQVLAGIFLAFVSGVAFAAPQSVTLNWSDSGDEDGYVLQRNASACAAVNNANWVNVVTLPANTVSYSESVEGGAIYCYRVTATVAGVSQGWSNLLEVPVVDTVITPVLTGGQD